MNRFLIIVVLLLIAPTSIAFADQQFSVVSPEWVYSQVDDESVLILDVRVDPAEYFSGHVPNAVNIADTTMRGPKKGIPVQYLPVSTQAELLKKAGLKDDQIVVIYSDGQNVTGATMVAYVLERMGHSDVKIMDGGWTAYKASYKPSQQYPKYKAGKLKSKAVRIYVTLDEIKKLVGKPGIKLIDARSNEAYTGQISTWMRNGHIPGAINIDWRLLMNPDNPHKFKTIQEIQAVYDANGVRKTDDIIVYCGTSKEASLEYSILKHLLGYPKVRLYEGSWAEYCSHLELPVETAPQL